MHLCMLFLNEIQFHQLYENVKSESRYTQSPIIRNGPIRLGVEFGENLRNTLKNLRNAERSDFQSLETSNIFHLYSIQFFLDIFIL
jgi:hypothetical protein